MDFRNSTLILDATPTFKELFSHRIGKPLGTLNKRASVLLTDENSNLCETMSHKENPKSVNSFQDKFVKLQ